MRTQSLSAAFVAMLALAVAAEGGSTPVSRIPPDIDLQRPAVAAGVSCPANLLDKASERAAELVKDVVRFSATENLVHENLDARGIPVNHVNRTFDYVVDISRPTPNSLSVREYRSSSGQRSELPEHITSNGIAELALVFHPSLRDDFEMTCEGQASWENRPAWIIHFLQRKDRPVRLQVFLVNGIVFPVRLKGRVWISAGSLQIVHLESDMVKPVPEIRLNREHVEVSYGPVIFKKFSTKLWLPMQAELYVEFGKHHFARRHSFENFMLFTTDTQEKVTIPDAIADHGSTIVPNP